MSLPYPELKLLLDGSFTNIDDACKTHASIVRESLINTLLLIELDDNCLRRIRLGEAFRRSVQIERQSTPYRLRSVISTCKEGSVVDSSLEAKFYKHGGIRAVTALAVAAADKSSIMRDLESLTDIECESLVKSITRMTWHPDLEFMAESLRRKPTVITSKKTQLVRPRPSRSAKNSQREISRPRRPSQFSGCSHRSQPCTNVPVIGAQDCSNPQQDQTSQDSAAHPSAIAGPPYTEAAMSVASTPGLTYDPMFSEAGGPSDTIIEINYGIDLDSINCGIDLDRINAF